MKTVNWAEQVLTWILVVVLIIIGWSLLGVVIPVIRDYLFNLEGFSYLKKIQASVLVLSLFSIWIIFMIGGMRIAHWRGRNGFFWAWLSLIGIIMVCLLPLKEREGITKGCPECAEIIKDEAKICCFCGHKFIEKPKKAVPQKMEKEISVPETKRVSIPAKKESVDRAQKAYLEALEEKDRDKKIALFQQVVRQYMNTEWADRALEEIVKLKKLP